MKKHTMLGVDLDRKKCCVLKCLLSFNDLINDELEASDFTHESTNWCGCDDIERTLKLRNYKPTGCYRISKHPIIFNGHDSDMGNFHSWSFCVNEIWELEE